MSYYSDLIISFFSNESNINALLRLIAYLVLAPIAGGLLSGVDRKLTAWMQGRVGPPLLQPFWDVFKLLKKEYILVNVYQNFYVLLFLIFVVFSGSLFFLGADLLLIIFALTLAGVFFALAGFSVNSPYCHIGAEREILQMMAYDPMLIILAIGMYLVTGSFNVSEIYAFSREGYAVIYYLPAIFAGYLYILTIKFRKSPFDLAASHHAHQELVRGLTTEFSGKYLAVIEIAHWYENVMLLAIVYLFFAFNVPLALFMVCAVWASEIFIDNVYARFKWQLMFKSAWLVTLITGATNIIILYYVLPKN